MIHSLPSFFLGSLILYFSMFSSLFFNIKDWIYGFSIRDGKANLLKAASGISYLGKESKVSRSLIITDSPQRQHGQKKKHWVTDAI